MKLHLDPRTKLFLILLCVLCAMFSPSLYFQFALVSLIALLALVSGKPLYALRGIAVYAVICAFTVWCMGVDHDRDDWHVADNVCGVPRTCA